MRRAGAFLAVALTVVAGSAWSVESLSGAVRAVRELTPIEQATHVLNRLAFGPRPGDVDGVVRMGVDRWIETQLDPRRIPDAAMDRAMASFPAMRKSSADLLREYPPQAAQQLQRRLAANSNATRADSLEIRRIAQRNREFVNDLLSAKVARAVVSERQLHEVMTDFWENHFNVFIGKQQLRYYIPEYTERAIRPHALGNFRELLGAVAKSPAMLLYLDNAQSVADSGRTTLTPARQGRGLGRGRGANAIRRMQSLDSAQRARLLQAQQRRPRGLNENYARELLALHTCRTLSLDESYSGVDNSYNLTNRIVNEDSLGPADSATRRETVTALTKAISELPEIDRNVVVLYHYEDLYLKEIGEILTVSESRVSQILTRATERLRLKMRRRED
jgi:RNA polymerase sigma factor (sigma-70 family)